MHDLCLLLNASALYSHWYDHSVKGCVFSCRKKHKKQKKSWCGAALPLHPDWEQTHWPPHQQGGAASCQLSLRGDRDHVRSSSAVLHLIPIVTEEIIWYFVSFWWSNWLYPACFWQCHSEELWSPGLPRPRGSLGEEAAPSDHVQVSVSWSKKNWHTRVEI